MVGDEQAISLTFDNTANAVLLNAVDHDSLPQFGIRDFLGNVINNKIFQSVVKSVVKNTLLQRGIPLKESIPGASPPEVARMLGGLVMHPQVAEYVAAYKNTLQPEEEEADAGVTLNEKETSGKAENAVAGTVTPK